MGACTFTNVAVGRTAKEAFGEAVSTARHMYGHGGYTGTIAEKREFVMVAVPSGRTAKELIREVLMDERSPIFDKSGPAGCIDLGPSEGSSELRQFVFFGWAAE